MLEFGKVKVWAFIILKYFLTILHSIPCTYETEQLEANFALPKRSLIGLFWMHGVLKGIPCPSWFLIIRFPDCPWSWAAADTRSRLRHFQQKALLVGMKAHLWGSESNVFLMPEDLGAAESVMWVKSVCSVFPICLHTGPSVWRSGQGIGLQEKFLPWVSSSKLSSLSRITLQALERAVLLAF